MGFLIKIYKRITGIKFLEDENKSLAIELVDERVKNQRKMKRILDEIKYLRGCQFNGNTSIPLNKIEELVQSFNQKN